jgi:hypothetical protein
MFGGREPSLRAQKNKWNDVVHRITSRGKQDIRQKH